MPFYIYKNNEQIGPLDDSVIEEGLRAGKYSPLDLASRDGAMGWESLSTFFPFISQSRSAPPSSSVPPPPSTPPAPPPSLSASVPPPPPSPHTWMRDSAANQTGGAKPFEPQQPGGNLYAPPPYQPPLQQTPQYQIGDAYVAAPSQANSSVPMAGMVLGIVTMCLMVVGLVPCLGWLNWVTLSVGTISVILCFVALVMEKNEKMRNKAVIGLSLTLIALFVGTIRLVIGGGCV